MAALSTITSLPAALASALHASTVLPVDDATGATRRATVDQIGVAMGLLTSGATDGLTIAQAVSNARRFNVRNYGAIGDGATNDSAAFAVATAKAEVAGGTVEVPGGFTYLLGQTWVVNAARVEAVAGGPGVQGQAAMVLRGFSGDLVRVEGAAHFTNILFADYSGTSTRTGAALRFVCVTADGLATADASTLLRRAGFCRLVGCRVTAGANEWERIVDVDGTLCTDPSSVGVRDLHFENCYFFGCRTADETVRIRSGTHLYFSQCAIVPAPTTTRQGLTADANSTDIYCTGCDMIGTLTSSATNLHFTGSLGDTAATSIALTSSALYNVILVTLRAGTVSNASATSLVQTTASAGPQFHPVNTAGGGGFRVTHATGGNLAVTATNSDVRVESLNALPLSLRANNATAATAQTDGSFLVQGTYAVPLWLTGYAVWVDTSGRLRIKNGVPANATDGTVVGTQA